MKLYNFERITHQKTMRNRLFAFLAAAVLAASHVQAQNLLLAVNTNGSCGLINQRNNGNGVVDGIFSELGCISLKKSEIVEGIRDAGSYSRQRCHEYVADQFTSDRMAKEDVALYEKVLGGRQVHSLPPICLEPQQGKLLPWKE